MLHLAKKTFALVLVITVFVASATLAQEMDKPPQHAGTPAPAGTFKFAVISDLHGGRPEGSTIFPEAVQELNLLDPDFVICVGDLIRGYADMKEEAEIRKKIIPMWDEFDAGIAKLKRPFYYVFGNHDVSNALQLKIVRERYGAPYYSFNHKGAHFIVLLTEGFDAAGGSLDVNADKEQKDWLKKDLDASKDATHTFVFFHKPWPGPAIMDLFKGRPTTVFAGHWHSYQQFVKDGINYHVLSSTGGGIPGDFYGGDFYQYAVVTVTGREATSAMVRVGAVIPDDLLSESRVNNVWTARGLLRNIYCKAPRVGLVLNQAVEVRVPNPLSGPVKGFIAWTAPLGSLWKVTPERQEISIEGGGEAVLRFTVSCYGLPLATPETMQPEFELRVLGGRALDAYSPAIAGLDPLYNIKGKLKPDAWPYTENLAAFAKSVALPKTPFTDQFRHAYTLTVKNPFDRPLEATLAWKTTNPKWSVKPDRAPITLAPGAAADVTLEVALDGTMADAFPMPRLGVKAVCDKQNIYDEVQPMPLDISGVFRGIARQAVCRTLKTAPVLDGKLDDSAWKDATAIDGFILLDGTGEPLEPTESRIGATAEGLWLAFSCREPKKSEVRAKCKDHDSEVWVDDSCEIFLDTQYKRETYCQLIFNTLGTQFEAKDRKDSWNGPWQVKTAWDENGWTAEVMIPWASLGGKPAAGTKWGFNLVRGRQPWPWEVSAWSPTFGSTHSPERFGTLVFE